MPAIEKVRYTHDAIIDEILVNPAISQGDLAERFGYSQTWMSIIINSEAFQERLRERKGELVDPKLTASIEDRLSSLAKISLDALMEKVEKHKVMPLKTMELVAIAKMSAGDRANRPAAPPQTNNLYVVALPPQAQDTSTWLKNRSTPSFPGPPAPGGTSTLVVDETGVYSDGK